MSGNTKAVHLTRGTRLFANNNREEDDFYATDPKALEMILPQLQLSHRVWECACGMGHLSKVLQAAGYDVRSTDLVDRGFGESGVDFLATTEHWDGDILTNPPFKLATQFVLHALDIATTGHKVIMFMPLTYLEGKTRWYNIYRTTPPQVIYVSTSRLATSRLSRLTGEPDRGIMAFAWWVWEKGYTGETILRWFNTPPVNQISIFD